MINPLKSTTAAFVLAVILATTACQAADRDTAPPPTQGQTQTVQIDSIPESTLPPKPTPTPELTIKSHASPSNSVASLLKELLALAKTGKVPGIPFAAHSSKIEDVVKAWGEADSNDEAGKGIYAPYGKKKAVFGYNKGSVIIDVRSSDPKLQKLTLKQIEFTLGKPDGKKTNGDDDIYVYQANRTFQLKFIIPRSTDKVHHVSVYSPRDAM